MILRLTIENEDRTLRFDLGPGEHVLGSAADCAVRIANPVISRHHARIVISVEGVTVADLGSSNGTRANGESVSSADRAVRLPAELSFGTVTGHLAPIQVADAEAAIAFDVPRHQPVAEGAAPTTVGLGSSLHFVAAQLPPLLARLAADDDVPGFVAALGAALFDSLPLAAITIVDGAGGTRFQAERPEIGREGERVVHGRLRLTFVSPGHARAWETVLRIASPLLDIAESRTREAPATTPRAQRPPAPPDPQTVVAAVRQLYDHAARLARSDVGIVVTGESGTGKEVLARFIHAASRRRQSPFVPLNCAALPGDLLESELFGVERGAATGVVERPGRFEMAHGGTLFLDEIGDMLVETQAKILRALEEKEVYRVGGTQPRPADVRVLAATNRDLEAMLADGRLRRDLYHRIADWRAELPPLRSRRADVPNLAAYFLRRECARHGVAGGGISQGALEALLGYPWPGNIRELEREMGRAALFLGDGQLLESSHLRPEIVSGGERQPHGTLQERLEAVERGAIREALEQCSGDVEAAAGILGLSRSTLYRRIKKLGIESAER